MRVVSRGVQSYDCGLDSRGDTCGEVVNFRGCLLPPFNFFIVFCHPRVISGAARKEEKGERENTWR